MGEVILHGQMEDTSKVNLPQRKGLASLCMSSVGLHIGQYSDAENGLDNVLDNLNKTITACQVIYGITKVVKQKTRRMQFQNLFSSLYCRTRLPEELLLPNQEGRCL